MMDWHWMFCNGLHAPQTCLLISSCRVISKKSLQKIMTSQKDRIKLLKVLYQLYYKWFVAIFDTGFNYVSKYKCWHVRTFMNCSSIQNVRGKGIYVNQAPWTWEAIMLSYLYRVFHFNLARRIFQTLLSLEKNISDKSCRVRRRTQDGGLEFLMKVKLKVI